MSRCAKCNTPFFSNGIWCQPCYVVFAKSRITELEGSATKLLFRVAELEGALREILDTQKLMMEPHDPLLNTAYRIASKAVNNDKR